MKKNVMMRVASALLVAVLLTTCAISGTFAKYVTSNEAEDSARVAKFGVVIQADGALFAENYLKADNTPAKAGNLSVKSYNAIDGISNLVAPGTKNEDGLAFSINGTPEVSTSLEYTIECENIYLNKGTYAVMVKAPEVSETSFVADTYYKKVGDNYAKVGEFVPDTDYYTMQDVVTLKAPYYPVVFKADETATITTDSLNVIAADYAKKLANGVDVAGNTVNGKTTYTASTDYAPNFNYASLYVAGDTLTWEWAIENVEASISDDTNLNKADTILGNLMAGTLANAEVVKITVTDNGLQTETTITKPEVVTDYYLNTSFSLDITVTQID